MASGVFSAALLLRPGLRLGHPGDEVYRRGQVDLTGGRMDVHDAHSHGLTEAQNRAGMTADQALALFVEVPLVRPQGLAPNQSFHAILGQIYGRSEAGQAHDDAV